VVAFEVDPDSGKLIETHPASGLGFHPAAERAREAGATVRREQVARTLNLAGVSRRVEGYRERWTLPTRPEVQARFTHEGADAELAKRGHKEIQTGDKTFDDTVFVRTETVPATTAFLRDPEVRNIIGGVVARGGSVSIQGKLLEGEAIWPTDEASLRPSDLFARLALVLMNASE
jgi:hypothetical protein